MQCYNWIICQTTEQCFGFTMNASAHSNASELSGMRQRIQFGTEGLQNVHAPWEGTIGPVGSWPWSVGTAECRMSIAPGIAPSIGGRRCIAPGIGVGPSVAPLVARTVQLGAGAEGRHCLCPGCRCLVHSLPGPPRLVVDPLCPLSLGLCHDGVLGPEPLAVHRLCSYPQSALLLQLLPEGL